MKTFLSSPAQPRWLGWWFRISSTLLLTGVGLNGVALPTRTAEVTHQQSLHRPSPTAIAPSPQISPSPTAEPASQPTPPETPQPDPTPSPEPTTFPTFNSQQLDHQLQLYLQYLATKGRPDILIIGSSRALQGIDPIALQQTLNQHGYPNQNVFNFGINGATVQVVRFLLAELLRPEQLPRILIWADGARAFNSGRVDRTYENIQTSPGYQQLQAGQSPQLAPSSDAATSDELQRAGLQVVQQTFEPKQYFRKYPAVTGQYDGDYQAFTLSTGPQHQAMQELITLTRAQKVPLVFVNLPLTDIYLDPARRRYEQTFRRYKQHLADQGLLTFYDLGQQWPHRYEYFADPSHLNQVGAQVVAQDLGNRLAEYLEKRLGVPPLMLDEPAITRVSSE